MLHLVGEVTSVELDLEDGFIQVLKLRQCKDLREEFEAHRLEMDVTLQLRESVTKNLVMVKCK